MHINFSIISSEHSKYRTSRFLKARILTLNLDLYASSFIATIYSILVLVHVGISRRGLQSSMIAADLGLHT